MIHRVYINLSEFVLHLFLGPEDLKKDTSFDSFILPLEAFIIDRSHNNRWEGKSENALGVIGNCKSGIACDNNVGHQMIVNVGVFLREVIVVRE